MPLERSGWLTDQSVAMGSSDDIAGVLDALRRMPDRSFFTKERAQREIADEISYQLVVHPEWIRPHVPELVRNDVAAAMRFDSQCLLMEGSPDEVVDDLAQSAQAEDHKALTLLLASRHPAGLAAVARLSSSDRGVADLCRHLGFESQEDGPLNPRFTTERKALRMRPDLQVGDQSHAVGLPVEVVSAPGEDRISFHYLSVTPAQFRALPKWDGPAHMVAPRHWPDWTLTTEADADGRLRVTAIDLGSDRSLDELTDLLDEAAARPQLPIPVELQDFDDSLTYANQHPLLTPNVIGVIGGPPLGLAPAPDCPSCRRLMFHVGWIDTAARQYGDGFRSLFVCSDCRYSATLATLYN